MELYDKYKDNRKEYTYGKDKYIKEIIALAMKEKNKIQGIVILYYYIWPYVQEII